MIASMGTSDATSHTALDPAGAGRRERLNQIARIPAARAPSMSAGHESPTITASAASQLECRERVREDPRIGFGDPHRLGNDQGVDVRIEAAEPHLALLLRQQIVGHDRDPHVGLEGGENGERAFDRTPGRQVRVTIGNRRGSHALVVLVGTRRGEQDA